MTAHDHDHGSSFDDRAATWDDDPDKLARAQEVAAAIRSRVPLDPTTRVLEYGAGTGLLSQSLGSGVGPILLTDVSEGMLGVMRGKAQQGVIPNATVRKLDLLTDPAPDGEFDLVTSLLALHHVSDTAKVLRGLYDALAPGGHLAVSDLDAEDGSFHGEGVDVHHGFPRDELTRQLTDAGFEDIAIENAAQIDKNGRAFSLFLATARKPLPPR